MLGLGLTQKVAFVTGAASGIGEAAARRLRAAGACVCGFDRSPMPELAGNDACAEVGDVTSDEDVARAVGAAVERFGRLDVVVNCAGITADGVLWKQTDEQWRRVLDVNLTGSFRIVRAAVPALRRAGGGSIVLVSSINALRGKFGQANYAASKAGVIGLAKTAAQEAGAFGIRVNVVAPGYVQTPMTAGLDEKFKEEARAASVLGRLGEPDDVAGAILFLASDLSRYVTGTVLRVDGGQCMGA